MVKGANEKGGELWWVEATPRLYGRHRVSLLRPVWDEARLQRLVEALRAGGWRAEGDGVAAGRTRVLVAAGITRDERDRLYATLERASFDPHVYRGGRAVDAWWRGRTHALQRRVVVSGLAGITVLVVAANLASALWGHAGIAAGTYVAILSGLLLVLFAGPRAATDRDMVPLLQPAELDE